MIDWQLQHDTHIYAPEPIHPPPAEDWHALSDADIDLIIEETLAAMPPDLHHALENVEILVEELPSTELMHRLQRPPHEIILGVYEGTPRSKQPPWLAPPAFITLFKRNLERLAGNRTLLMAQVKRTLLHEIGHHLGLNEQQVRARGL